MYSSISVGVCNGWHGTSTKKIYLQRGATTRLTFTLEEVDDILERIKSARQKLLEGTRQQPTTAAGQNTGNALELDL